MVITDALQAMIDDLSQTEPDRARRAEELVHQANKGFISIEEANEQIATTLGLQIDDYLKRKSRGEIKDQALLDHIKELRQDYKTGLLSNVSNGGLLRRFHVDELVEYFDATIASGEIGFAKPEPQAYEIIADKLGVRLDECVFTDDREVYCDGARAVGMKAILYENFMQFKKDLAVLTAP